MRSSTGFLWAVTVSMAMAIMPGAFAKLDCAPLQWTVHLGGDQRDSVTSAAVLGDGSVLALGFFERTFWPAATPAGLIKPSTFGYRDVFWAKFNADGTPLWVHSGGSRNCDFTGTLSALPDGSFAWIAAYGYDGKSGVFGYNEAVWVTLPNNGDGYDVGLGRFNADGTIRWMRGCGGVDDDYPEDLSIAPDGGCYFSFYYSPGLELGRDDGVAENDVTLTPDTSYILVYYDADGVYRWCKQDGNYSAIETLSDGSCVTILNNSRLRCYSSVGEQRWEMAAPSGFEPDSLRAPMNSEVFYVSWENGTNYLLGKYRQNTSGAPTKLWEKTLASRESLYIGTGPDGYLCARDDNNAVWVFDGEGTLKCQTAVTAPIWSGVCVGPDHSIVSYGTLYEAMTVAAGQPGAVTLPYWGSGDIFLAKYSMDTLYSVVTHIDGLGYVRYSPMSNYFHNGDTVTLTALPNCSIHDAFDYWSGDFHNEGSVVSFTVEGRDYESTAHFVELPDAPAMPAAGPLAMTGLCGVICWRVRRRFL